MSATEQVWFTVGVAGFIILLEGAISYIGQRIWPRTNLNFIKGIGGALIYVFALIMLLNVS